MAYSPSRKTLPPDIDPEVRELYEYLLIELELVSKEFLFFDVVRLKELHEEPARPRDGMVVFADGTDWDPGSGAGFYGYYGSAWNKLG